MAGRRSGHRKVWVEPGPVGEAAFYRVDGGVTYSQNLVSSRLTPPPPPPPPSRSQKWPVYTEAGKRADLWLINPDQIKAQHPSLAYIQTSVYPRPGSCRALWTP